MKHSILLFAFTLIMASSFSQAFYISTARRTGNWSDGNNWTITQRRDGIKANQVIIPKNTTIYLDVNFDATGLGNVEMEVYGKLVLLSNTSLKLTQTSKITVKGGTIVIDALVKEQKSNKNNVIKVQIIFGNVVKFDATLEDEKTGNTYASVATGFSPAGFSSNAVLPVQFVSFSASKANDALVAINWTTSDEINNSHFEVQRSTDGIKWAGIAMVFPDMTGGNTHAYTYRDKYSVKGVVYYRIRQVDIDGKEKFSSVKMIGGNKSSTETMIYVSSKNTVTVDVKNSTGNNVIVRLISMNGVIVNQKINNPAGEKIILDSSNVAPGAYVVQVTDMKGMFAAQKVIL